MRRPRRELSQHRVECQLDPMDGRRLVEESFVAVVDQHRGVYLEHDEISGNVQPAIDAEIFEADALPDGLQRLIMRRD